MSGPSQPESTERCAVGPGRVCTCSDANGVKWSGVCPAHYWRMYGGCTCNGPLEANGWPANWQHAADCKGVTPPKKPAGRAEGAPKESEITFLRRALAEAETLKRISDSQAHEAWIERDGALARLAEAEKLSFEKVTIWARENGRAVVALDYLNGLTKRAVDAETRLAEAEKELAVWRDEDAREAKYEWVSKQARAAEERAAQAERERDEARRELGDAMDRAAVHYGDAIRSLEWQNLRLTEAARHIVELGYDRATQGARWCRFCGRNPLTVGHARRVDGDTRSCPLARLEAALVDSRAEPRAAASEAVEMLFDIPGAQGEEK